MVMCSTFPVRDFSRASLISKAWFSLASFPGHIGGKRGWMVRKPNTHEANLGLCMSFSLVCHSDPQMLLSFMSVCPLAKNA